MAKSIDEIVSEIWSILEPEIIEAEREKEEALQNISNANSHLIGTEFEYAARYRGTKQVVMEVVGFSFEDQNGSLGLSVVCESKPIRRTYYYSVAGYEKVSGMKVFTDYDKKDLKIYQITRLVSTGINDLCMRRNERID